MRLFLLSAFLLPALAVAQGQLTPPDGAVGHDGPAPTMKTLDQHEPRRPLRPGSNGVTQNANGGFTISASGSYYLEGNLTVRTGDGIVIDSGNVSLDLSGYTIFSFAGEPTGADPDAGIRIAGAYTGIAIANGHIWSGTTLNGTAYAKAGFSYGVFANSTAQGANRITNLSVTGTHAGGIHVNGGHSSLITGCSVHTIAGHGIAGHTVVDCVAENCGTGGINAETATGCHAAASTSTGPAIYAITATGCTAIVYAGNGDAIRARVAANCHGIVYRNGFGMSVEKTATNCFGDSTNGTGLYAANATNCFGTSTSGIGLNAGIASNCSAQTATGDVALVVTGSAANCRGNNAKAGGKALTAAIAVSCTTGGGTIDAPQKFLGTP